MLNVILPSLGNSGDLEIHKLLRLLFCVERPTTRRFGRHGCGLHHLQLRPPLVTFQTKGCLSRSDKSRDAGDFELSSHPATVDTI